MPYTTKTKTGKPDLNKLLHSIKDKQGIQIPCPAESHGQEVGVFLYLEEIPDPKHGEGKTRPVLHIVRYFLEDGVRYMAFRKLPVPPWRLWDDVKIDGGIIAAVAEKMFEIAGQKVVHKSTDKAVQERDRDLALLGIR